MTPEDYRDEADDVSYKVIDAGRAALLGTDAGFTIETAKDTLRRRLMLDQDLPYAAPSALSSKDVDPIEQWPDPAYLEDRSGRDAPPWPTKGLELTLAEALQVAARNSQEFQTQKELVFQSALALDLEEQQFRKTWTGLLSTGGIWDSKPSPPLNGTESAGVGGVTQQLKNGSLISVNLALDLVKLTNESKNSSLGKLADVTIAIPLLRGSGEFVVTEPLKQAERNVVYAIYAFERFKRAFAVDVATAYYTALQEQQGVLTEQENYRWLIGASRRAMREAEAQRVSEIEVDQTLQDELQARDDWIGQIKKYELAIDTFKNLIGVPVDAELGLVMGELASLRKWADELWPMAAEREVAGVPADAPIVLLGTSEDGRGPVEMDSRDAIVLALQHRLDLRVAVGRVFDAQRQVAVGADGLRADLTLFGRGLVGERRSLGQADEQDSHLHASQGVYTVFATLDLPLERTFERNVYRNTLINFEQIVRDVQRLEDDIKFQVREDLRLLTEAREGVQIQAQSLALAQRRVDSTTRFMRVDRADARDVLDSQTDLVFAENSYYSALVGYRVAELGLQRDLGLLLVTDAGLWTEYLPDENQDG